VADATRRLLVDHAAGLVPEQDMMRWVHQVVAHGVRRPGTAAGHRVEGWVADQLRAEGVKDVRCEPFPVRTWSPGAPERSRLLAWPAGRPAEAVALPGFPLPYTRATDGLEADVVRLDSGPGAAPVSGAIAVESLTLARLDRRVMEHLATAAIDPGGELDAAHLLPFGPLLGGEADRAVAAGAAAYVGLLATMPWTTRDYYVPYDGIDRLLPALWLDREDGARLVAMLDAGPVRGRVETAGTSGDGVTANVVGVLPGASEDWVVVGTHHDAPWASAVEDATGVALVLAQAAFWAAVPAAERPHNLLFLLNGAHMAGGEGMRAFVAEHPELIDRIVASVHLEHAAADWRVEDGRLVAAEGPEVGWWFTSRDPGLVDAVTTALRTEGVRRSWVLPPDAFGAHPPTDGGILHLHGVPVVDFLSAPVYLFDSADTPAMVHAPSLEPISRAVVRIIGSLMGRSAADVRT
jgi:Peptidase family M28